MSGQQEAVRDVEQRGTMSFSRWRVFMASADESWAICFFGSNEVGRDEQDNLAASGLASINRMATRVEDGRWRR